MKAKIVVAFYWDDAIKRKPSEESEGCLIETKTNDLSIRFGRMRKKFAPLSKLSKFLAANLLAHSIQQYDIHHLKT